MEEFEFGDILKGQHTVHPIIFFSIANEEQFYGCIVTHAGKYKNNFALEVVHFQENNANGERYPLQFDDSFCAKLKLEKQNEWGPYEKVGLLSDEGKEFVRVIVENEQPTNWERYIKSLSRRKRRVK